MAVNTKFHPVTIDLNEFKIHIALKDRNELTLHFNSPSRKFYLTVIAFVVNEMKKLGKITSIPVETHYDLLALLNNTIGETAGSSDKEHLLPRIYRKWKDILPNLEEAHLFKVLGRRKEYDQGVARTYHFTEAEKDNWANLFEYKGSEENVRLKFAVDRIGAGIDDIVIIYEGAINGEAWERFILSLGGKVEVKPEKEEIEEVHKEPVTQVSQPAKVAWSSRYRWAALIVVIVVVAGLATIGIWESYIRHAPQPEVTSKENMVSLQYQKPLEGVSPSSQVHSRGKLIVEAIPKEKGEPLSSHKVIQTMPHAIPKPEVASKEKMAPPLPDKPSIAVQVDQQVGAAPSESRGGSKNPEAYLKSVEATEQVITFTRDGVTRAQKLFKEIIALEPDFSRGYSGLALSNGVGVMTGMSNNPRESLSQAIGLAQKAISLNETDAINHAALAYLFAITKQHDKAVMRAERALALDTNSFPVMNFSGLSLMYSCRGKEALTVFEKAEQLNPSYSYLPVNLSWTYRLLGRYEEAFQQAQKAVERAPWNLVAQVSFTASCNLTNREAEARAAAEAVLKINPNFSVERYQNELYAFFKDKFQVDPTINALRKAGLK